MSEGWISIHRKIENNWVWKDKPFSFGQAWIDLILLANHADQKELKDGKLVTYKSGTVNRSILWLSERWGWERRKTTRFIKLLESDEMVAVKSTTHGTTITIVNYELYRYQGTTDGTTVGTTDGQPMHNGRYINNNDNNVNNVNNKKIIKVKPVRHKYGYYKNVLLSDQDIEKLKTEFPNDYLSRIERVSEYCRSKGKSYSDYLATIRSWARKENNGAGVKQNNREAEEQRNREIDEVIRRIESGEADHDDDGLWDRGDVSVMQG